MGADPTTHDHDHKYCVCYCTPMSRTTLEVPADDAISLTLSNFKPEDLLSVIEGLKKVTEQDPAQTRALLEANPDLTYAVLQAQFLMGMIDEQVVAEAMNADPEPAPATPAPAPEQSPEPAPAPAPAPAADPLASLPPEQAAMVKQVVGISPEQLALLPPEQQEQVRALKQQFGL